MNYTYLWLEEAIWKTDQQDCTMVAARDLRWDNATFRQNSRDIDELLKALGVSAKLDFDSLFLDKKNR